LLDVICWAGPSLPSATRPLGGDAAEALPSGFVATIWIRSRAPRSVRVAR
jgi:hypothetical protein